MLSAFIFIISIGLVESDTYLPFTSVYINSIEANSFSFLLNLVVLAHHTESLFYDSIFYIH